MFKLSFDLYVQLRPGHVAVESPDLGRSAVAEGPGFSHPRLPVGDFGAADAALKAAIAEIRGSRPRKVSRALFHVQHEWEGGLTVVDLRAIKDLAMSTTGSSRINVYVEPADLSESEIQRLLRAKPGNIPGLV